MPDDPNDLQSGGSTPGDPSAHARYPDEPAPSERDPSEPDPNETAPNDLDLRFVPDGAYHRLALAAGGRGILGEDAAPSLAVPPELRAACRTLRRDLVFFDRAEACTRIAALGTRLGEWLRAAESVTDELALRVPAEEQAEFTRLFVASEEVAVHELLFELIDIDPGAGGSATAAFPQLTDRWALVRTDGKPAPPRGPLTDPGALLLVLGSHHMAPNQESARTSMVGLLTSLVGIAGVRIRWAAPRDELAFLRDPSRVPPDSPLARLVRDPGRCVEIQTTDQLLAELRRGHALVAFVGHSVEAERAAEATAVETASTEAGEVESAAAEAAATEPADEEVAEVEALRLDLGLFGTMGVGPTFDELAEALDHRRTRALAVFACNVGPTAGLALIERVEHVVLTCARLRAGPGAAMLGAWVQALADRREVAEAVRQVRAMLDPRMRWLVQHWTRSRARRLIADPDELLLESFRQSERRRAEDHRRRCALASRPRSIRCCGWRSPNSSVWSPRTLRIGPPGRTWFQVSTGVRVPTRVPVVDESPGVDESPAAERGPARHVQADAGAVDGPGARHHSAAVAGQKGARPGIAGAMGGDGSTLPAILTFCVQQQLGRHLVVLAAPGAGKTVMMQRMRAILADPSLRRAEGVRQPPE